DVAEPIGPNGLGYAGFLRVTMGDQVLGLEAALADGTVIRTRAVARSTSGLDLKRLFIGTEGTLGIVTAATLRVFPVPEKEEIRAWRLRDFPTGFECLSALYDDGLSPSVMDVEETVEGPALPWGSGGGPATPCVGFAGNADGGAAAWTTAR